MVIEAPGDCSPSAHRGVEDQYAIFAVDIWWWLSSDYASGVGCVGGFRKRTLDARPAGYAPSQNAPGGSKKPPKEKQRRKAVLGGWTRHGVSIPRSCLRQGPGGLTAARWGWRGSYDPPPTPASVAQARLGWFVAIGPIARTALRAASVTTIQITPPRRSRRSRSGWFRHRRLHRLAQQRHDRRLGIDPMFSPAM